MDTITILARDYNDSFKPYYKWITFNILIESTDVVFIIERINFYIVAKFNHLSTS